MLKIINKWPGRFTFGTGARRSVSTVLETDASGKVTYIDINVDSGIVSIMTANNMQPTNNFNFGKASNKKPHDIQQDILQSIFSPLPPKRKAVVCLMEHITSLSNNNGWFFRRFFCFPIVP